YKGPHLPSGVVITAFMQISVRASQPYCWLSGEAGLGQYTGEENPTHAQNAAESANFGNSDIQHGTPRVNLI
ncbi:MAG: hypothetical protein MJA30_34170, partial [Cytophagales bacterium]|nr:hypothetical protein [Cytophagales bacterium]